MKQTSPGRNGILYLIAIPMIFWLISVSLPLLVSGLNWFCYRYFVQESSEPTGRITVFKINSKDSQPVSGLKFPLTRKSDFRFDYERFKLQMIGLLEIKIAGTYWFGSDSDDDSWIWIDGNLILDNGGLHPRREMMHFVNLTKGIHSIEVQFENRMGEAYLDLFWAPSAGLRQALQFRTHPLGRLIPFLYRISTFFFKISQYGAFILFPLFIYRLLFPQKIETQD
jgi:fibro-slime domain-containing protein